MKLVRYFPRYKITFITSRNNWNHVRISIPQVYSYVCYSLLVLISLGQIFLEQSYLSLWTAHCLTARYFSKPLLVGTSYPLIDVSKMKSNPLRKKFFVHNIILKYWKIFFSSLDSLLDKKIRNKSVPNWNYFILKFQFFMLYFLAGIKKSNWEWLEGYAMNNMGNHWVFIPFR